MKGNAMIHLRILVLAQLLVALGAPGCRLQKARPADDSLPPVPVRTRVLAPETRRDERRFSGYLYPWEAHGVGFLVAGRVKALHVEAGQHVTRGQLLAELVPEDYALVQRLSEIQVQALAPNVERVDALVGDRVLPASTQDELRGKYQAALTQREQARRQLGHTRLTAPVDGVVLRRDTAVGQVIGAGMPAVTLLEVGRMKLKLGVTQQDLASFAVGRELEVGIPGFDGPWRGAVDSVALVPDPKTRTYEVALALPNPDERLRPGLLGHVRQVAREKRALFLPLHLVRHDLQGRAQALLLDRGTSRVVARPVTLGEVFGLEVEVAQGLAEGEVLITDGGDFVVEGEVVSEVVDAQAGTQGAAGPQAQDGAAGGSKP
jgi:RND family efflux transporter MFP subunit